MTWVSVFLSVMALIVAVLAFREAWNVDTEVERQSSRIGVLESAAGVPPPWSGPAPDAYRTPAEPPDATAKRYCVDCRFRGQGMGLGAKEDQFLSSQGTLFVCLAQPADGRFPGCGGPTTNANHDCSHYQKKKGD